MSNRTGMVVAGLLSALGIASVGVGCDVDMDKKRDTKDAKAVVRSEAGTNAANAITAARCEREQKCDNLGSGKKYASMAECNTKLGEDLADDFNSDDCPGGIDSKELNECLAEIKNHDCKNPLDKLESAIACRESDICKSTPRM